MLFKVEDKVVVKDLDTLLKSNDLKKVDNLDGVYWNANTNFVVFENFNFYGSECVIQEIDEDDNDMPYFLSTGIWVPEFMIQSVRDKKPIKNEKDIEPVPADFVVPEADFKKPKVDQDVEPVKVYINKFNNKPFGKLFVKLIKLDEKVAEFSSTSFSKLKKHELQYIAKLIQNNGAEAVDYARFTKEELAKYCFKESIKLNV